MHNKLRNVSKGMESLQNVSIYKYLETANRNEVYDEIRRITSEVLLTLYLKML
jgi:hypothetical protein